MAADEHAYKSAIISIREVLPLFNGTSCQLKYWAVGGSYITYYHPYNQERAINLSILNMSGMFTHKLTYGISINQSRDITQPTACCAFGRS